MSERFHFSATFLDVLDLLDFLDTRFKPKSEMGLKFSFLTLFSLLLIPHNPYREVLTFKGLVNLFRTNEQCSY